MQLSPFNYGGVVFEKKFSNRVKEIKQLQSNFLSGIHTIVISPRRWGKSSLVKQATTDLCKKEKHVRVCYLDMFKAKTETHFYEMLAAQVLKVTSSRTEDLMKTAKDFLNKLMPSISFGIDSTLDVQVQFDIKKLKSHADELLDLPEKIARKKNLRLVVCIDEFQYLDFFENPMKFQRMLRASWQHHEHVSYCVYGSKQSLMAQLFQNAQMPFYKFGDIIWLDKISEDDLSDFVQRQFKRTKKSMPKKLARRLVNIMKCHPYYVQNLAKITWYKTGDKATDEILDDALEDLLRENSILFERETDQMTTTQLHYLHALINEKVKLTSKKVIRDYDLGSSSIVVSTQKALEKKEIIHKREGKYHLLDPAYEIWLERYFRI